jgi:hypothetical protein
MSVPRNPLAPPVYVPKAARDAGFELARDGDRGICDGIATQGP